MNLLNKIGQRAAAKYLFIISVIMAIVIYGLKSQGVGVSNTPVNIITVLIGIFVFSFSNLLLSIAAHKSRTHRVMAIFISAMIVALNTILFALSLYSPSLSLFLFLVSIVEILFSIIFIIIVVKSEKERVQDKLDNTKQTAALLTK